MDKKKVKKEAAKPQYILFNAKGKILGRFAVEVARTLSGKGKIDFAPNVGGNDWAIVINSDKIILSGEKASKKIYYRHSGYPGSIRQMTFEERMEKDSTKVIFDAVKGMLPKNKLSREALKRLRVYKDDKHEFENKLSKKA
jgi:large subunit ribosomal protein L13